MKNLWGTLCRLALEVGAYVPFTQRNVVWKSVDKKYNKILDVGCGDGKMMGLINRHKQFSAVAVEIHEPTLRGCRMRGVHSDYIIGNAVNLPVKRKSFDTVLCSEVLEHLEKKKGWEMIRAVEEIACKRVIISMPSQWPLIEKYDTVEDALYGHKSSWSPHELRESGYRVRGFGLRHIRVGGIRSEGGLMWALPRVLRPLGYIIWVLAGPFVWFFPKAADHMICIKKL